MNLSALFIRRPVMTTLLMLAIMLFGIMGFRLLPVSDLPSVDFPTITVRASLPGASPETMASAVATPLERQFSTIAGLDSMNSSSNTGSTQITLQFDLSRNIDAAAQDVESMIVKTESQLPSSMPSPPSYQKVNPADQPILYLTLNSATLPLSTVDEYAETTIAQRISMVSGVAQVQVFGSQKYAVRIQLDPKAMATRGIGINQVASAVANANVNLPTGTLYGKFQAFQVEANGQLTDAAQFNPLIVAYRNGSPVRISDIGMALDSVEDDKSGGWYDQKPSITLAIQRQPGTNTVEVVNGIRKLMPTFRAELPASVNMSIMFDRSESIRESVRDVEFTLLLTICLVVLVIFLFLRNLSATVIPSLALPMSIVGTFAFMYLLGYSVDNLSMMALTLSVGFVVDDAIVMLENIMRHVEMGERPLAAAFNGSREVSFTILSMTLSLAAVFIPVLFMGGILGRLLHEFAVVIGVAILVSGVVSLSLTPMLSSRFIRPHGTVKHSRLYETSERGFTAMLQFYDWSLKKALLYRKTTMVISAAVLVVAVQLFIVMPKGFLPSEDTGMLFGTTEAEQGISYDSMVAHQKAVAGVLSKDPNVMSVSSSVGGGGSRGTLNNGRVFVRLKPRSERKFTADQVIEELRPKLDRIPGMRVYLQNLPPIRIGGQLTKSQYQYTLQAPNTAELYRHAPVLESELARLPQFQDVTTDLQIRNPQVNVEINRNKAASLGVTASQIEDALYTAYGSRQVSTIYAPNNEYEVLLELAPQYQMDPAALSMLYIQSQSGALVPLNTLASVSTGVGPFQINHLGQLPSVTVSFNLSPGVSLSDAVAVVDQTARKALPPSISGGFQGTAQAFESSAQGLGMLLLMAVAVIYIVLGILYESFIHPLTILSGLPAAGFGALVTLELFKMDLNIYAFVGIIMLVGLVKKNAIMMIDFALDAQRSEGKPAEEAIYRGCLVRFRPIMMTTMSALMAGLPIALGFGAGGESRRPLGLAVVGGLLFSQFLTLYITPVIFVYMEAFRDNMRRLFHLRNKQDPLLQGPLPAHHNANPER